MKLCLVINEEIIEKMLWQLLIENYFCLDA